MKTELDKNGFLLLRKGVLFYCMEELLSLSCVGYNYANMHDIQTFSIARTFECKVNGSFFNLTTCHVPLFTFL